MTNVRDEEELFDLVDKNVKVEILMVSHFFMIVVNKCNKETKQSSTDTAERHGPGSRFHFAPMLPA
jgi:hypothetical protein